MKYLLLAVMSLVIGTTIWHPLVIGCRTAVKSKADTAVLTGDWYLQPVLASDTATGKLPMLQFDLKGKTFTGFTGCNAMNGSFRLQGDTLQFNERLAMTKMMCEGYNEKDFIANLLRVNHYKIENGILWLMIDQSPVSKWVRKPGKQTV